MEREGTLENHWGLLNFRFFCHSNTVLKRNTGLLGNSQALSSPITLGYLCFHSPQSRYAQNLLCYRQVACSPLGAKSVPSSQLISQPYLSPHLHFGWVNVWTMGCFMSFVDVWMWERQEAQREMTVDMLESIKLIPVTSSHCSWSLLSWGLLVSVVV